MSGLQFSVGDKVLASREESGENHEQGEVVDSYELIMGDERRPMVVVRFEDGEQKYMTAKAPNVLPVEDEEPDEAAGPEASEAEPVADDGGGKHASA